MRLEVESTGEFMEIETVDTFEEGLFYLKEKLTLDSGEKEFTELCVHFCSKSRRVSIELQNGMPCSELSVSLDSDELLRFRKFINNIDIKE